MVQEPVPCVQLGWAGDWMGQAGIGVGKLIESNHLEPASSDSASAELSGRRTRGDWSAQFNNLESLCIKQR